MKRVLTNWWFVSALAAVIAVLLLCIGLPIFVAALRPWWVRLLLFVLIAGIWGGLAWWRLRKARKASEALEGELGAQAATDGEAKVLGERMVEALRTLKTASGKQRRDYLYSRPWYVIIGPPGAGKTTALVNSGLRFPFSSEALKGVGGTRNLDFLFADEAVLVDTAGRYTSQDSDATEDAKGWEGFLGLLRKHRPLQPINGVIVALGADLLLGGDRAAIDQHAVTVRRRLAEVRRTLEINVPVYVLVTKADLLSGFVEYYEDLDVEGRRAVLGHTLPFADKRPEPAQLAEAFDAMALAVEKRQAGRLAQEQDPVRSARILGFPGQINALRARLLRFLDGVFVAGDMPIGVLRGFYLTSGVQQGAPLDRLLAGMADIYEQPQAAAAQGSGRAYFLNRLLGEVMFAEAGLVQLDPAARKRQRLQLVSALAGVAVLTLVILSGWGVSFARNRAFQAELLGKANAAKQIVHDSGIDLVEVREGDPGLEQSLDLLRAMRTLPQGYAEMQAGGPGLTMQLGLFERGLSDSAVEAYRDTLRRVLLPRILLQLERSLKANQSNPLAVYEPLKVYLMLGGQHAVDKTAVRSWVSGYWASQAYPGPDAAEVRKELGEHLDVLLGDPDLAVAWPGRRTPIDGALVASSRAAISNLSMAERAYAILKQKGMAAANPSWSAANVLASGDAQAFENGDALLQATVPYFYTRAGYEKSYQIGVNTVQKDLKEDLWVFGNDAQTMSMREQLGQVRGGVAQLYARDYIAAWEGVIALLKPKNYFNDPVALAAIGKTPSPLKLVLLELRKNTSFGGGTRGVQVLAQRKIESKLSSFGKLGDVNGVVPTAVGVDAGTTIESYFSSIHEYVGDGKAPAPIDAFVAALGEAGAAMETARRSGAMGGEAVQAAMSAAMAKVGLSAAGAPPLLQGFVSGITKTGDTSAVDLSKGALAQVYTDQVAPACKEASQDRFPFFAGAANDVTTIDLQRVFGMGGVLDSFVQQRLKPLLDTSGPIWRWKAGDPVAATLDPATPDSFAKAQEVRDLIVGGLALRIEPSAFAGGVDAVQFQSGDANLAFSSSDRAAKQMRWSAQGGAPSASVTLLRGGQKVRTFEEQGVWALFRLMDKARRENSGATSFLATFGDASGSVTFRVGLPSEHNPFSRGGMWTFRCPLTL